MDAKLIKRYIRPLLRWWWLVLAATIIAATAAAVFVRMRDPVYVTSGMVMVGNSMQEMNPEATQIAITRGLAETYVRLAQYGTLREKAQDALGLPFLPDHVIQVVPESQLIEVMVTDTDPVRAQAVALELINQLIALSPGGLERQQRQTFAQDQMAKLEASILATENEVSELQIELAGALSARQIRQIEDQIAAQNNKLSTLRANYVGLVSTTDQGSSNTIRPVELPNVPTVPVQSNDLILIVLAGMMGAALAVAGVYLLEMFDNRLGDVEALRDEFGMATLGSVPESIGEEARGPLIMVQDPHTMAAESFRVLRTNLLFASVDRALRTMLVTSPGPGEGKSYVSSNMAVAFAQAGKRVVLIDADLRKPTLHRVFGLLNNAGVTTALLGGKAAIEQALQPTPVPGLFVMTSGPLPPNPSELLSSNRMNDMLKRLSTNNDLVIVDTPPVTVVSDTAVLASRVDGVLVVFSADNLGRDRVHHSLGALNAVHANLLGAVLNRTTSDELGFHYSYKADYGNRYYKTPYSEHVPEPPKAEKVPVHMQTEVVVQQGGGSDRFNLTPGRNKLTEIQEPSGGAKANPLQPNAPSDVVRQEGVRTHEKQNAQNNGHGSHAAVVKDAGAQRVGAERYGKRKNSLNYRGARQPVLRKPDFQEESAEKGGKDSRTSAQG